MRDQPLLIPLMKQLTMIHCCKGIKYGRYSSSPSLSSFTSTIKDIYLSWSHLIGYPHSPSQCSTSKLHFASVNHPAQSYVIHLERLLLDSRFENLPLPRFFLIHQQSDKKYTVFIMVHPTSTCCKTSGDGSCVCAAQAKCSCGKESALHCTCNKAAAENTVSGARCSCSMFLL
jgi:hypothetical protein